MKSLIVKLGFDRVPDENTCQGLDVSPMIEIEGLNATSLAVIVDDPDAPSAVFTHWLIWNIPPINVIPGAITKKATTIEPFMAVQGTNDR
jgi:Raf kinase inhibitor-like YbhB/YbcL family protein